MVRLIDLSLAVSYKENSKFENYFVDGEFYWKKVARVRKFSFPL